MTLHWVTESTFLILLPSLCLLLAFTFLLPSTGLAQVSLRSVPLPFQLRTLSLKVSRPTKNAHVEGILYLTYLETLEVLYRGVM